MALKQLTVFAVFRPLLVLLSQVALAIVLYKGSQSVLDNVITIGTLYIFINYNRGGLFMDNKVDKETGTYKVLNVSDQTVQIHHGDKVYSMLGNVIE